MDQLIKVDTSCLPKFGEEKVEVDAAKELILSTHDPQAATRCSNWLLALACLKICTKFGIWALAGSVAMFWVYSHYWGGS